MNRIPYSIREHRTRVRINGSFILSSSVTNTTADTIIGSGLTNGIFSLRYITPNLLSYDGLGKVSIKYKGLYSVHFHFKYFSNDLSVTLVKNGIDYAYWRLELAQTNNASHLLEAQTDVLCDIDDILYFKCTGTQQGSTVFSIEGDPSTPYYSWGNITLLEAT